MKFRLKPYDEVNDIYLLQKKVLCFWFNTGSVGSKKKLNTYIEQKKLDEFNATRHP